MPIIHHPTQHTHAFSALHLVLCYSNPRAKPDEGRLSSESKESGDKIATLALGSSYRLKRSSRFLAILVIGSFVESSEASLFLSPLSLPNSRRLSGDLGDATPRPMSSLLVLPACLQVKPITSGNSRYRLSSIIYRQSKSELKKKEYEFLVSTQ